jgi:hypothetical protein
VPPTFGHGEDARCRNATVPIGAVLEALRELVSEMTLTGPTRRIYSNFLGEPWGVSLRKLLGAAIRGISPGQHIAVAALWISRQRPTRKTISIVTSSNSLVGGS